MFAARVRYIGAAIVILGLSAGCTHHGGAGRDGSAAGNGPTSGEVQSAGAPAGAQTPDLTKQFVISRDESDSWLAPLNIAKMAARSAGGTWAAFAPKPLDDVKWVQNGRPASPGTVQNTLETLRKQGTPIAWENEKSFMLLDFAPPADLVRIRTQPPSETVGLFIRAETIPAMLQAVSSIWRVQVEATPDLVRRRSTFEAALKKLDAEDEARAGSVSTMMASRYDPNVGKSGPQKSAGGFEYKEVERLDTDTLMQRLARFLGGKARHVRDNRWEFSPLSDANEIAAECGRLKTAIDQETAAVMAPSTSYDSRIKGDTDVDVSSTLTEAMATMSPLSEQAQRDFNALGVLGKPAVATLAGYLDAGKPPIASVAVRILDAMDIPEAKSALIEFASRLQTPPKERMARLMLAGLHSDLIRRIGRRPDPQAAKLIAATALNEEVSQQTRMEARMTLAKAGDLTALEVGGAKEVAPGEFDFVLRDPPAGSGLQPMRQEPKHNAVTPLAATRSADGDDWAVFVSDRLGDPNDLWLARGRDGKWIEFLFTGHQFSRQQEYSQNGPPKPGSCTIKVEGDHIAISPPGKNTAAELERLQKQMSDPKLAPDKRSRVQRQYYELSQKTSNLLDKAIPLSLAELRKDSDRDGLPDLIETRLGLNPFNADTDGDGVPDGKDANPLASSKQTSSPKAAILQAVFTALYGGDTSRDPILVILDRGEWQEFTGAKARTICIAKEDYQLRIDHLASLRILQFGGPQDADSTILKKDGSCLFNEDNTRAEVHFWQWHLAEQGQSSMMNAASGGNVQITDYIAKFERKGDWKLVSIAPCHYETGESALMATARNKTTRAYGGAVE